MSSYPSYNTRRTETPDSREAVFARIKEALRIAAPKRDPHHHSEPASAADLAKSASESGAEAEEARQGIQAWLPRVSADPYDQMKLFRQNAADLQAQVLVVKSHFEVVNHFKLVAQQQKWVRIATHPGSLAESFAHDFGLPVLTVGPGYPVMDLEASDAAFTDCDALVAQTGSILVSNASAGGRALSVLPTHHVVFARPHQLVPDLAAALQLARDKYATNWPSFLSFITGPSRTGDIERILVLGAHGPKFLTIVIFDK